MSIKYKDFAELSQIGDIKSRFSNYEYLLLQKLAHNKYLIVSEISRLQKMDVLDDKGSLTVMGRLYMSKINKKKAKSKNKPKKFKWERHTND